MDIVQQRYADDFYERYTTLPDAEVIAEIVRLAQTDGPRSMRIFSRLIVSFVEDCKVTNNGRAIDKTLLALLEVNVNHSRIVTGLRTSFSVRKSLEHWYAVRDKTVEILKEHEPERGVKLMRGLHEEDMNQYEEMDGLDTWQSILKECQKYA